MAVEPATEVDMTPRKLRVIVVPERHRPAPSFAIGFAIIPVDLDDNSAIIEWICLDTTTARDFAADVVDYCDDVDAMNLDLASDRGD